MRIVALDPGKQNFAYAVISEGRCTDFGHVRTITDLHHERVPDQLTRFRHDINETFGKASPRDWMAFERMQHRPCMGAGAVVEYINLMIGICLAEADERNFRIYPVAPVTWKRHFIRQLNVDPKRFSMATQKLTIKLPTGSPQKTKRELVQGVLEGQTRASKLSPHEGDAIGIGCYVWQQLTGMDVVGQALM